MASTAGGCPAAGWRSDHIGGPMHLSVRSLPPLHRSNHEPHPLRPRPPAPPAQRARRPRVQPGPLREGRGQRRRLRVPRPGGCRRPRRQGSGPTQRHRGAPRHRLAGPGQDHLGADQQYRHPLHVQGRRRRGGTGRRAPRHHPDPQGRRAGRRLHGRCHGQPDRGGHGPHREDRHRGPHRDHAGDGERRGHRHVQPPPGGNALRRGRLCRELPGPHHQHRRPEPGLSGRPVARRPLPDAGGLSGLRHPAHRRPVRRLQRPRRLPGRRPSGRRPRLRGQVGHPPLADRVGQ